MICCKIVTNLNNEKINILLTKLAEKGNFIIYDKYIYFCDSETDFSEKDLKKILKKYGFSNFFLDIYNKDNPPRENEEINGWIYNEIMKLNYNMCEKENQKVFHEIWKGLDLLEEEIENIKNKNTTSQD